MGTRDFDLCTLVISDDSLYASALAQVGTVLSATDVKRALTKAGIVGAYPDEQIDMLLDASAPGEPVLVAAGTPPELGVDARIEYFFETERRAVASLSDYDNLDWRSVHDRSFVKAGAVVARKHPPTRGVDGRDLFGQRIVARNGEDVLLQCGENVAFGPDGRTLVARKSGIAKLAENGSVSIADVVSVKDVDLSTGSVCTLGAVMVDGNVTEGFIVEAAGDVYVHGNIEAGTVIAGGRVIVGGGLRHHGKIEAVGDVAVRFVDPECSVQTLGDLTVVGSAVGARLTALGRVVVGHEIAGGRVESATHIECRRAGSEASVRTLFVLGHGPTAEAVTMAKRELTNLERRLGRAPSHDDDGDSEVASLKAPPVPVEVNRGAAAVARVGSPLRASDARLRPSSLPQRPGPRLPSEPPPAPTRPSARLPASIPTRPGSLPAAPARPGSLPAAPARPGSLPAAPARPGSLPAAPARPGSLPARPGAPLSSMRMPAASARPSQQLLARPSASSMRAAPAARAPDAAIASAKREFQLEYQMLATERQIAFHDRRFALAQAHVHFVAIADEAHPGVVVRIDREEVVLDAMYSARRFVVVDGAMKTLPLDAAFLPELDEADGDGAAAADAALPGCG
jgi:hypothetical protein